MKTPSMMMNEVLKKRAKKNKKGFSLVELIVVLVIMAILAAALVPTLIGYINQTRQSNAKNEASACVQAAQTLYSNAYANPASTYTFKNTNGGSDTVKITTGTGASMVLDSTATNSSASIEESVAELAEVTGTISSITFNEVGVVNGLTYEAENGEEVTFDGEHGTYTVA